MIAKKKLVEMQADHDAVCIYFIGLALDLYIPQ
jgi:hypothetical protein